MQSPAPLPVQVFVVAPPLVGWGLQRLVSTATPRQVLVGTAGCVSECSKQLEALVPDVVLVDIDDDETPEAVCDLYRRTHLKILVITSKSDGRVLDKLVTHGARGVLKKREAPSVLLKAIEAVHEGAIWVDQACTDRIFMDTARRRADQPADGHDADIATLTMRERQTIAAVTSDTSAPCKVIAGRLCMSEHTLRNHLTSIYGKLGLRGRVDLYAFASRHGLSGPHA